MKLILPVAARLGLLVFSSLLSDSASGQSHLQANNRLIVIVGAGGEPEYQQLFERWKSRWRNIAEQSNIPCTIIDGSGDQPSRSALHSVLNRIANQSAQQPEQSRETVWLILIGHGTFDGTTAKFNLVGPDISARELAGWLKPIQQPTVVINTASASGPFINHLSAANRIVVSSTKSGYEFNFARFGDYLSRIAESSIDDPLQFDLDKDEQVSLLEMVLAAATQVKELYDSQERLLTEHSLIDDNGDGLGTPASWFRGVRVVQQAKDNVPVDGLRANQIFLFSPQSQTRLSLEQIEKRNKLEQELEVLRSNKGQMEEEAYYQRLEQIMLRLGKLYLD